jgi:hypothetical protein
VSVLPLTSSRATVLYCADLDRSNEFYMQHCGRREPHLLYPCTDLKQEDVWVNVVDAVRIVRYAFEKMGHPIGPWLENM